MMLPISLANVAITGALFLWAGREGVAWMGIVEWAAFWFFVAFSQRAPASVAAGSHSTTAAAH